MSSWLLMLLTGAALLAAADPPRLSPPLQRHDLAPSDIRTITLTLSGAPGTRVTMISVDCACLKSQTPLPASVPALGQLVLPFRVTGMRPGVEEILVATDAGVSRAQVQIIGAGGGRGLDQVRAALQQSTTERLALLAIAHDLSGNTRHCGCSQGALGGAGRLARLPALARDLAPGLDVTWVLTGDVDGHQAGLGKALAATGWRIGDPRVLVTDEILPALTRPGITAVIPTAPAGAQHRRIVEPTLTGGMAVELLLVDAQGQIQVRRTMPIDDSLPDDPALVAQFRDVLTSRIEQASSPSQSCVVCHATAGVAWATSRHAHALDSLKPEDRTDGCISCHVTPTAPGVVAPGVSCQSCHQGGEAHAASAGKLRTAGTTDCRSCHDARHHPAFRRELAWPKILHGREPAK